MFFEKDKSYKEIQDWIAVQLPAVYQASKNGIDVEIRPHKQQRTNEQNRFLMAILVALVRFYDETGFMPKGVDAWAMRTDVLKTYYKHRFGVANTHKLDTKSFGEFIDKIQLSLVEESGGNWEILQPDSAYVRSLIESGGI